MEMMEAVCTSETSVNFYLAAVRTWNLIFRAYVHLLTILFLARFIVAVNFSVV
jgi:hypothetical protein